MVRDRENEEFANVVLLVAIVIYIFIAAALYAGLAVKEPDLGAALGTWAKEYGSIIAGIPVLVAVLVAKQQLDEHRRQHVANIRRLYQRELEALFGVLSYSRHIIDSEKRVSALIDAVELYDHLPYPYMDAETPKRWRKVLPPPLFEFFDKMKDQTRKAVQLIGMDQPDLLSVKTELRAAAIRARKLEKDAQAELDRLSQYWS
jgi:hypothetical protein